MSTKPQKVDLELCIWPDSRLKTPVKPFPSEHLNTRLVKNTAGAMIKRMYEYSAIGLAAPQVGVPFQIFVMDVNWLKIGKKHPRIFINPSIVDVGEKRIQLAHPGEGCLSFPYKYHQPVPRLNKVELEWEDFHGNIHHEWFEENEAITVQHEVDHLMGIYFFDRLSSLKKNMALNKAKKIRRKYLSGYKKMLQTMKNAPHTAEYNAKRQKAFEAGFRSGKEQDDTS